MKKVKYTNEKGIRLDSNERKALKFTLKDFACETYLFGSRTDNKLKGRDIDILLVPKKKYNTLKLSIEVQKSFFTLCKQDTDVVVYSNTSFCREILRNAKKLISEEFKELKKDKG